MLGAMEAWQEYVGFARRFRTDLRLSAGCGPDGDARAPAPLPAHSPLTAAAPAHPLDTQSPAPGARAREAGRLVRRFVREKRRAGCAEGQLDVLVRGIRQAYRENGVSRMSLVL